MKTVFIAPCGCAFLWDWDDNTQWWYAKDSQEIPPCKRQDVHDMIDGYDGWERIKPEVISAGYCMATLTKSTE